MFLRTPVKTGAQILGEGFWGVSAALLSWLGLKMLGLSTPSRPQLHLPRQLHYLAPDQVPSQPMGPLPQNPRLPSRPLGPVWPQHLSQLFNPLRACRRHLQEQPRAHLKVLKLWAEKLQITLFFLHRPWTAGLQRELQQWCKREAAGLDWRWPRRAIFTLHSKGRGSPSHGRLPPSGAAPTKCRSMRAVARLLGLRQLLQG